MILSYGTWVLISSGFGDEHGSDIVIGENASRVPSIPAQLEAISRPGQLMHRALLLGSRPMAVVEGTARDGVDRGYHAGDSRGLLRYVLREAHRATLSGVLANVMTVSNGYAAKA